MLTGGFYRTPLTKPSCKLSRAVIDSDKDGAKQVPPQGPQAQLHLHLWGLGFGGFGAHHTLRGAGLRMHQPHCARPHRPAPAPLPPVPTPHTRQPNLIPCLIRLLAPRPQVIKLLRSAPANGTKANELRPLTYAVRLGRSRAVEALLKAPHPTHPCPVAGAPQHTRCTTSTHPVGWVPLHMSHLAAQR